MKFIGTSSLSKKVLEKLEQLVSKDIDVLLEGEKGTGRDFAVQFILGEGNYQKLDCSQFVQEFKLLGDSSFTHLYLDNLEFLPQSEQIFIQKLIESRSLEFDSKTIHVKGRILFSSSLELVNLVKNNEFREDLFRKVSTIKVQLPTLRERKEDILLFSNYFISKLNQKHNKKIESISEALQDFLLNYLWPGNISQLEALLEGIIVFSKGKTLDRKAIPSDYLEKSALPYQKQLNVIPGIPMEEYEKEIIRINLLFNSGNREKTAKILGISERTLYRKIKEFNIKHK